MTKKLLYTIIAIACCMVTRVFAQVSDPFIRFPSLSPYGTEVAFEYDGDIWKVASTGGVALRLTVHEGYDTRPKWSPDGKQLAFSGMRYGNYDVFVMSIDGGYPERITYHSANDILSGWTATNDLLFTSRRTFVQIEPEEEILLVSRDGGTPKRIIDAPGFTPEYSPNGRFLAFVTGSCPYEREEYRGSANKDILLYDTQKNNYTRLTDFDGNDFLPHWTDNSTLYYISSKNGRNNIFLMKIDDQGKVVSEEQVTFFKDDGARYFTVSNNGKKLALERQASVYIMDIPEGKPYKLDVSISSDYHFDPIEYKTYTGEISEYDISPNGKLSAFVIRGEIFITENNDKKKSVKITDSPYRDRDVKWVNDSTLMYISDREGQYDLYCAFSADKGETSLFRSLKITSSRLTSTIDDERNPVISPDGKKVAYRKGNGMLIVADITPDHKISNEKVLLDGWASPEGIAWSPDSHWLAYSLTDLYENEEIYIQVADKGTTPVNLSMHPKSDVNPCWSNDGTKLGFISYRNNGNADIWFVWLKKSDWEKTKQEWDETEEPAPPTKNDKNDKGEKKEQSKPIIIDTGQIHERLQQVTALPGNESDLCIAHDGNTFYFVTNRNSRFTFKAEMDLFSVKWDGTDMKPLTKGDQKPFAVSLNPAGTDLFMLKTGGTLFKLPVKSDKMEPIAFSAKMKIDYEKEKDQIFEEAWRSLDQNFYDPGFHGKDWKDLRKKYKPWAMKASTYFDFRDIINCMLGELNASHMALGGGQGRYVTQNEKTGLPGIDIEPLEKGVRVTHVTKNSPADKSASKINAGDIILSVNGMAIDNKTDFWSLLTNETEGRVLFEIKDPEGNDREVVLRPAENLRQELYEEWVDERKQLVDKYSAGRLGYIHIQGMSWPSFERFERELTACGNGKEGIVIDVRYNGGGWTTDYLMAILNVKQHAYCIPRGAAGNLQKEHLRFRENYPFGERLPYFVWNKPSIALCNENSYSNAEIFSHAYKSLGIGKLVGLPTFGAVISTGANTLLDGSYIRLPFRAWYVKNTDINMELNPAVPDIILDNPPDYKAKGEDLQLKTAVEELLKDIDNNKNQR